LYLLSSYSLTHLH